MDSLNRDVIYKPMDIEVFNILSKRYPSSQYALMAEVSNAAGFDRSRSCDFLAMGLWPSRGLDLTGFELKRHRSDWLGELKKPAKAESFFKYCDRWYLLTVFDEHFGHVAKPDEIPAPWGWIEIKGSKCHVIKEAPKLEPAAMTRNFLAALLKRSSDKSDYVLRNEIKEEIERAREAGKDYNKYEREQAQKELRELMLKVKDFEHEAGVDIHWRYSGDGKEFGKAIKFVKEGGVERIKQDLFRMESTASAILKNVSNVLDSIRDVPRCPTCGKVKEEPGFCSDSFHLNVS